MKRRHKILFSILGGAFCLLALAYCWFAFSPTGLGQAQEELVKATEGLQETLRTKRQATTNQRSTLASVSNDAPTEAKPPSIHTAGKCARELRDLDPEIFMLGFTTIPSSTIDLLPGYFETKNGLLRPTKRGLEIIQNVAFIQQGAAREDRQRILIFHNEWLEGRIAADPSLKQATTPEDYPRQLHETLDRFESILLDSDWRPAEATDLFNFGHVAGLREVNQVLIMAIIRAGAEDDRKKASRLLEIQTEILRYGSLHIPQHIMFQPAHKASQFIFPILAETDSISTDQLDATAHALAESALTPDEIENVRRVFAERVWQDYLRGFERMDQAPHGSNHLGTFGKARNATLSAFLNPLVKNLIKKFTVCLANGDKEGLDSCFTQAAVLGKTMNFLVLHKSVSMPGMDMIRESVEEFEQQNEYKFSRLILAAAQHKKTHSAYPERIEDLIPQFLGEDFLGDEKTAWDLRQWSETHRTYQFDMESDDPIDQLCRSFMTSYKREPIEPIELARHAHMGNGTEANYATVGLKEAPKLEAFAERFRIPESTPYTGNPIFYRIRDEGETCHVSDWCWQMEQHGTLTEEDLGILGLAEVQVEDYYIMDRRTGRGKNAEIVKTISVDIRCPLRVGPQTYVSPELIDLLSNRPKQRGDSLH